VTVQLKKGRTSRAVAKSPTQASKRAKLRLAPGRYHVMAPVVTFAGKTYRAHKVRKVIRVAKKSRTQLRVVYRRVRMADQLFAEKVSAGAVTLRWKKPKGMRVVLRRAAGSAAPAKPRSGSPVRAAKRRAVASGLAAGGTYSFALFSKVHRKVVGRSALTITIPRADGRGVSWSTSPSTTIISPSSPVAAVPTGNGVRVTLPAGRPVPQLGAGFVLPISAALPGGYLGVVSAISADGRTITLRPGGFADAFDYYNINADLSKVASTALTPVTNKARAQQMVNAAAARTAAGTESPVRAARAGILGSGVHGKDWAGKASVAAASTGSKKACDIGGSANQKITLHPTLKPSGYFKGGINKTWGVPHGGWWDMRAALDVGMTADVNTTSALNCALPFKPVMTTLATTPVPVSLYLSPIAEVSISGEVEISNLGAKAQAGFWTKGELGLTGAKADGGIIKGFSFTNPAYKAVASVNADLGGEIIVGPGAGTSDAGVIAGIGGTAVPVKVSGAAVYTQDDTRRNACLRGQIGYEYGMSLNAKAWLGSWSVSKSVQISALQKEGTYGNPAYFPSNCEKLDPGNPSDSVGGDNVDLSGGTVEGGDGQSGYIDGLVPGAKTWVLSTGNIADAVGDPDYLASSDIGLDGDTGLDELAGAQTWDAVRYTVNVVPKQDTLHVRYIFASEEYPEYVNKGFNDVMAVFVNGQNCAYVPGTTSPVSVDTVNADSNSEYFVDNQAGASGYHTTFDGLTKPLECSVPVTPGKQVTVEIVVADTGDHILDSAVGLLDRGIWSD